MRDFVKIYKHNHKTEYEGTHFKVKRTEEDADHARVHEAAAEGELGRRFASSVRRDQRGRPQGTDFFLPCLRHRQQIDGAGGNGTAASIYFRQD